MPSLLIAGGLTVDRFGDGRSAAGGSVLHAGLAASLERADLAVLTIAGPEPEALEGIERLRRLGHVVAQPAGATTTYRHEEAAGRRVLVLERAGEPIRADDRADLPSPDVALFAPIAAELPAPVVEELRRALRPRLAVFLIQGWLRRLMIGEPVHPLGLGEVDAVTWDAFGAADVVVVSTEDLTEAPGDPFAQAAELRGRLGSRPLLVVTLGAEGYLLDDPAAAHVVASVPRRVVDHVPTVGAGDTFGAALAVHLARGRPPADAAAAATERVISVLESRR